MTDMRPGAVTDALLPAPLAIRLGDRSYDILIGSGVLSLPESYRGVGHARSMAVIVSNTVVAPLYADRLAAALAPHHRDVRRIVLPDGEAHKTWTSLDMVFDGLLDGACDRRTVLYALGGGVVGDITGFAAACYMRGVPFVQVPTTLLAQVDSSVGGKTGINHPRGKNMIGAFYQPQRVVADLDVLSTLPVREVRAGLAEVIKHGLVADAAFFDWLELNTERLLALETAALAYAIRRCCEIKAVVVEQDERESGVRAILNFGHTFGHAIEAGMGYGAWLHGEAVGAGMVMAAELSVALGLVPGSQSDRVRSLIERAGLPVRGPALGVNRYLDLMRTDKKAEGGELRFVVLDAVGRASVRAVPDEVLRRVIAATS